MKNPIGFISLSLAAALGWLGFLVPVLIIGITWGIGGNLNGLEYLYTIAAIIGFVCGLAATLGAISISKETES